MGRRLPDNSGRVGRGQVQEVIITVELLKLLEACDEVVNWFIQQDKTDAVEILFQLVRENKWKYANWLIASLLSNERKLKYAIHAAKLVVHIFEKIRPENLAPRRAIESAEMYLKDPEDFKNSIYTASKDVMNVPLSVICKGSAFFKSANSASATISICLAIERSKQEPYNSFHKKYIVDMTCAAVANAIDACAYMYADTDWETETRSTREILDACPGIKPSVFTYGAILIKKQHKENMGAYNGF